MTNFKRLQTMTVDQLADWLDENGMFDGSPWNDWFNKSFCEKCEPIELNYEDSKTILGIEPLSCDLTSECAYCECHDHCRFFPEIKDMPDNRKVIEMWLIEEVENDSETITRVCSAAHY